MRHRVLFLDVVMALSPGPFDSLDRYLAETYQAHHIAEGPAARLNRIRGQDLGLAEMGLACGTSVVAVGAYVRRIRLGCSKPPGDVGRRP